jgi:hypothetical protein
MPSTGVRSNTMAKRNISMKPRRKVGKVERT